MMESIFMKNIISKKVQFYQNPDEKRIESGTAAQSLLELNYVNEIVCSKFQTKSIKYQVSVRAVFGFRLKNKLNNKCAQTCAYMNK